MIIPQNSLHSGEKIHPVWFWVNGTPFLRYLARSTVFFGFFYAKSLKFQGLQQSLSTHSVMDCSIICKLANAGLKVQLLQWWAWCLGYAPLGALSCTFVRTHAWRSMIWPEKWFPKNSAPGPLAGQISQKWCSVDPKSSRVNFSPECNEFCGIITFLWLPASFEM